MSMNITANMVSANRVSARTTSSGDMSDIVTELKTLQERLDALESFADAMVELKHFNVRLDALEERLERSVEVVSVEAVPEEKSDHADAD